MSSRWTIAIAGLAMQMALGSVYAWSVYKIPLVRVTGWAEHEVGVAFMIAIAMLAVAAAVGGRLVDRGSPRRVAMAAAVLFGLGTMLAGVAVLTGSKLLLWLGYGVVGGIGNGLGYVTPLAVLVRWFPDRRGLITGLAVMGFGLGAAVVSVAAPLLIDLIGPAQTLICTGAAFLLVMLVSAAALANPPEHFVPPGATGAFCAVVPSISLSRALRMRELYLLGGMLLLNVTAGIALISNLSPMAQSQLSIGPLAAGAIVLAGSVCNGVGRLAWAALSERIGPRRVFMLIFATQVPLVLLLPEVQSPVAFTLICCYVLLCYGGGFGTMPSFAAATFGPRHIGAIYGKILLAWGIAGVLGPGLMEWVGSTTGRFAVSLQLAAGLLGTGLVLAALYRAPRVAPQPPAAVTPAEAVPR